MRGEDRKRAKVRQIMPADGWHGVWAGEDGKPWSMPLVCWALVDLSDWGDFEDGRPELWSAAGMSHESIVGMTTGGDGYVDECETGANFLGYLAAGEDIEATWGDQAREYAERQAKKREAKP